MYLHLFPDSFPVDEFVDSAEKILQGDEGQLFIVYTASSADSLKHVKNENVRYIPYYTSNFDDEIVKNISFFTKVFIHYLDNVLCSFVAQIPSHIEVYWFFWGGDFYSPTECFINDLFGPKTKKLVSKNFNFLPNPIQFYHFLKKRAEQNKRNKQLISNKQAAIARVNYIGHFNQYDFKLITAKFSTHAKLIPFFYYPFSGIDFSKSGSSYTKLASKLGISPGTKLILLGNSATYTNNHLEALDILASLVDKFEFQVICPLSYGDEAYASKVIEAGKTKLGDKFIPLTQLLDKEEYFQLLEFVDVAFMNHKRTQAGGNLTTLILFGKKVFFQSVNTYFKLLKDNGLRIFDAQEMLIAPNAIFTPLTPEQQLLNKQIIFDLFSKEKAYQNLKKVLNP